MLLMMKVLQIATSNDYLEITELLLKKGVTITNYVITNMVTYSKNIQELLLPYLNKIITFKSTFHVILKK